MLRCLIILGFVTCYSAESFAENSVEISVEAVPLDSRNPAQQQLGKLNFRGGVALRSSNPRFGGFSAIHVNADGALLLAVSDRGAWLNARLVYDSNGRLIGVRDAVMGRLIGENGNALMYRDTDAEAMSVLPDGSILVAFERNHRILRYPAAIPPFSRPPTRVRAPSGIERAPANAGIEALTHIGGSFTVAIAEVLTLGEGGLAAWIGRKGSWEPFTYVNKPGFRVSDAAAMPNDDLLVLEHHYSFLFGHVARLARVRRDSIASGHKIEGEQIALIGPPLGTDNFEGVAVRRGDSETAFVYLISDDNFNPLQRTLLFMFALPERDARHPH